MIPYVEQPILTIGPFTVSAFGVLAVAAIVLGWRLTPWQAARLNLDPVTATRLARLMVMSGFAGAALAGLSSSISGGAGGFSSMAGLAASLAAGSLYLHGSATPLRYFDAAALAFPSAWTVFRAGCALAHDHIGTPSTNWLAVQFPGGPRWDVGLIEMLAIVPLAVVFLIWPRFSSLEKAGAGMFAASLAIYLGLVRLALDRLRIELNADRWFAGVAIVVGAVFLWSSRRSRHR